MASAEGSSFPYAVLPSILHYLDVYELSSARLVNKGFCEAASSQALWANFPLSFLKRPLAAKRMTDQQFLELDQRAGNGKRTRLDKIDLQNCYKLTSTSLEAILQRVDKHAEPPRWILISHCRITSAELVDFLIRLDQKLDCPWDKSETVLCFVEIKAIFADNLEYLQQFQTIPAFIEPYGNLCGSCRLKSDGLGMCGRCHQVECCESCKGRLCKQCKRKALCRLCSRLADHLERTHCRTCAKRFRQRFLCSMALGAVGLLMIAVFLSIVVHVVRIKP